MIHYHRVGSIPAKHHVTHFDDGKLLMEQAMTRAGFDSTYSMLYFRTPPTDEFAVRTAELPGFCPISPIAEQPLHRRHIRTQNFTLSGAPKFAVCFRFLRAGLPAPGTMSFRNGELGANTP